MKTAVLLFTAVLTMTATAQIEDQPPKAVNINTLVYKTPDGGMEYRDLEFGVSFGLPPSWIPLGAARWWDPGWEKTRTAERATTVSLRERQSNDLVRVYYRLFNNTTTMTSEAISKVLLADIADKVAQRRSQEQFSDYIVRTSSCESRNIGGQSALACVGEYAQNQKRMAEYLVLVQNQRSMAEFFGRVPEEGLDRVRQEVEPLVVSLRLP